MAIRLTLLILILAGLLAGCGEPATPTPRPAPTADPLFVSDGGGDPRSAAYWQKWSSCSGGDEAETARANGGRTAGWVILDDLLADPGMVVGLAEPVTCDAAVRLLEGLTATGDAAYPLAAELLTAQLNLAVPAEACPAAVTAVQSAQLLLLSLDFSGQGSYLTPAAPVEDRELATFLTGQLADYNRGALCR